MQVAFWVAFSVVQLKAWYYTHGEVTLLALVCGRLSSITLLSAADNAGSQAVMDVPKE